MGKNPAQKAKSEGAEKTGKVEGRSGSKKKVVKKKKVVETAAAKHSEKKCKMASCKRAYKAKGYCKVHYKKWRHGEYGRARFKPCKDNGCFKPMSMNRHGYCDEHFTNYYVKGIEVAKEAPEPKKEAKEDAPAAAAS